MSAVARVVGLVLALTLVGCDTDGPTDRARLESDGPTSGFRVALDGTTALVASSSDGPVAVHERGPDGWTRTADLLGEGADVGPGSRDRYGWAVALDDGVAVVGAHGTRSSRGRAYVFELRGDTWEPTGVLEPDGLTTESVFGQTVAAGAGRVFVSRIDPGGDAVYVYERGTGGWALAETIEAPDRAGERFFGGHLATDGESLVVASVTVDGDLANGTVYVYPALGPYDSPEARLTTGIGYDELDGLPDRPRSDGAGPLAVDGDVVVIGTPLVNVGPAEAAGGAVVFERIGGAWGGPQRLTAADPETEDFLGRFAVSVGGGRVSVGTDLKDGGAVYTFEKSGGTWVQSHVLREHEVARDQGFGTSLSQDGSALIVGAPYEDGEDGAAYVYRWSGGGWVRETP